MDTTQFIAFCDGIAAEARPATQRMNPYEEERVRIKDALPPSGDEGMLFTEFKKLRSGFVYLSIIDDSKDYSSYYYILEKISEHFNGSAYRIVDWSSDVWKKVIAYVKSLPEYPKTDAFINEFIRTREREVARAAKRLTLKGAVVIVVDCELQIQQTENIYACIEQLMAEIGGENALHKLLSELPYRKEIGRYLVPHQGNHVMQSFVELEKPYGYLFNLCLKYLKVKGSKKEWEERWEELTSIATDLCVAVYDSQKFEIWDDIIFKPEEVVRIVHELMFRFNLYTLPQTNVTFSTAWCRFLCARVKRDGRCDLQLKAKLESLERLMNWAVKVSKNNVCTNIKKEGRDGKFLESNMSGFKDRLVVDANGLNADFQQPEDITKVNGVLYPIVETATDYILLPKPLVVWNWYEAIYNIVKPYKVLTKDLGYAMEDFVNGKMNSHGIRPHTGEYSYNGIDGEVDFLVEATKEDAIIESKKKSLSLKAKAGDDYYIWGDLYEFIESQMQCARLENGAKNHGPITLTDKKTGAQYIYIWKDKYHHEATEDEKADDKNRNVLKVTMTLKEYGPLQDKVVLPNIIKSLLGRHVNGTFDAKDPLHDAADQRRIQEVFTKMNLALDNLKEYYKAIGDNTPTFHCRFYSMEQLHFLIRQSKNQDHFVKLLGGGYVSTGTENFWNEYLNTVGLVK